MKRRKPSLLSRIVDAMRSAVRDIGDGAVASMAQMGNGTLAQSAAEVESDRTRYSPLAFTHHMRDLISDDPISRKRGLAGRGQWVRALHALERNDPEAYAAYMAEVDGYVDAGELVTILPPELQAEASERARVSGPRITNEAINAPFHGVTSSEFGRIVHPPRHLGTVTQHADGSVSASHEDPPEWEYDPARDPQYAEESTEA